MKKIIRSLNNLINITIIIIILTSIIICNMYPKAIYTFSNNPAAIVSKGSKEEKILALSFDDGPHPKYTLEILDILKQYNVKATFFVLGKHAESYPDIINRQVSEGHEIGNHSYSHINMKKVSDKIIKEEFEKTQEIIYSISNIKPKVFRPPYGNYNDDVIKIVSSDNLSVVLWTFYQDSKDWSNPGVDVIVNTTLSKVQNGDIILLHDYVYKKESHTVEALKIILPKLIDEGYRFVTISELIDISQGKKVLSNFN
ncbi:polysaccharide deacetylase family protein [Tissierella sp.]|uniref:polysaccharide deacetylase family protein n=1 Tax=Tissierella sp. TaxID=41274 RepID=UPI0028A64E43|nr:polysaccharide deacetylase family protein [Tissierella sp.]